MEETDNFIDDVRLSNVLKQQLGYAEEAYKCLIGETPENTKLYLANLIGSLSTLYEYHRPEERTAVPSDPVNFNQMPVPEKNKIKKFLGLD